MVLIGVLSYRFSLSLESNIVPVKRVYNAERHVRSRKTMTTREDQRGRQNGEPISIAILHPESTSSSSANGEAPSRTTTFVDILRTEEAGILFRTEQDMKVDSVFDLNIHDPSGNGWNAYQGRAVWIEPDPSRAGRCLVRAEVQGTASTIGSPIRGTAKQTDRPGASDYEFFMATKLLNRVSRDAVCPLLNRLTYRRVRLGERILVQGDPGDRCFFIRGGECVSQVEKDGALHPVGRHRVADIVGEMAILTGEPRSAHVVAETNMEIFEITRNDFEELLAMCPHLRSFLTELVAGRFASRRVTADRRIGKYVITDVIGRGGYSIVYKGVHADLNLPVAIKMLKHDLAMRPDFSEKFRNEAKLIARFNHANIVQVFDIEECYGTIFIVTELLEGASLRDLLDPMPSLPFVQALPVLIRVCSGLGYAHERGIIHQDVKPDNIFILPSGEVKIIDFGVACPSGSEVMDFLGTLAYQSPEQRECLPLDERTDVYALGVTALEMLTGIKPSPEHGIHSLLDTAKRKQGDLGLRNPPPGLPEGLHTFFIKACHPDPERRYRNLHEVKRALLAIAEEVGIGQPDLPTRKRRMTTLVLLYEEAQELAVRKKLDDFSAGMRDSGVQLKAVDFRDL
jgi:CRP-like cAMP-binding protein